MRSIQLITVTAFIVFNVLCNSISARIAKVSKIQKLSYAARHDHKQKTERVAALEFHKLLNAYRKQNKLRELKCDESLWLTCRNHDIWMSANNELSHDRIKGTEYFTGIEPGDRYKYVTSGKGNCEWSGENDLYNFDHNGKTINEIAICIAKNAFQQWKDSPGQNENMPRKRHHAHGTAFYLGKEGIVYGADLFVSYTDDKYTRNPDQQLASIK